MEATRAIRRLSAIVAADIAGYSRLVRADEEGTIARAKRLRREVVEPAIDTYRGRIVKLMGDGILIEFSSAVDAVDAAVAIQQAMTEREAKHDPATRVVLRVGINLGDIVIDGDDIHGDGVNLAARLEGICTPGGICIADSVREQVRDKISLAFSDLGEQKVRNIDRPVRVWAWQPVSDARPAPEFADDRLALPDKPSIAVLPFDNMSADPEQAYFSDGIAEDIITALSRVEGFLVIARNSSFTYRGRAVDVKQVGRELGVRYVLEGSVRWAGQRLRVTAQLIDARSGAHVWAESYDRDLSDIFEVQDEITRNVVASTQTQIHLAEGALFDGIEKQSLPVWMLTSRALRLLYDLEEPALRASLELTKEAIALDPESSKAHYIMADALFHLVWMGFAADPERTRARGRAMAERAVRLDRHSEAAHWILGMFRLIDNQHDRALTEMERALEINPNFSVAHGSLGTILNFAGQPERAIRNNQIAIRSNPRDPSIFFRYGGLAISHFLTGDHPNAILWAQKSVEFKPVWYQGHVALIASLVETGRDDEARRRVADYVAQCPDASLAKVAGMPFRDPEVTARFVGALRRAGCPD